MKPHVVIVGAGLGGCVLANALLPTHEVTMIERGIIPDLKAWIHDLAAPAVTDPHVGGGLGGTTALWHNGLIEIDEEIFANSWPFPKSELDPFYEEAYPMLSGVGKSVIAQVTALLRRKYLTAGLPEVLMPGLFYPRTSRNVWHSLGLGGRVRVIDAEALGLDVDDRCRICAVRVRGAEGEQRVEGDLFVLSAGGLGTPVLLQQIASHIPLPGLRHAGCHYEDHPMTVVGELKLRAPLYQLWNFEVPGADGNLRIPLVLRQEGLHISFQLRPAAISRRPSRRQRVHSVLNELRNRPFDPMNYIKLMTRWDDILDILSFKFGIRIPTKHYTLLMMAQMPASPTRSIWGEIVTATGRGTIQRRWLLTTDYLASLQRAVVAIVERLDPIITSTNLFPNWQSTVQTGAHHSGTARMSKSPDHGVCDENCQVHGISNLYVVDGSVIPASGIANTGLTIAALALRLGKHLGDRPV